MYKISIIMPIFNVEKYLERALNSIINQTMDFKDIEVIMVDDCSTDNSRNIIEKYSKKYSNFIGIFHNENSGCAAIPRNTGLKRASGEYIMFLDPDDEFSVDICEKLYNTIVDFDADMAFGRYVSVFEKRETVEKSFSPFDDDIENEYPNLKFEVKFESKKNKFIDFIFRPIIYGGKINKKSREVVDKLYIKNINKEPILLMIPPSVWTKIYKKELIFENNIYFPSFKLGEDFSFVLKTFLKAKGIVFLNNFLAYNYSMRDNENNKSVSKDIDLKLLDDGIDNLIFSSESIESYSNEVKVFGLVPHILNWFFSWAKSNLKDNQNKYLIKKLYLLKEMHSHNLRIRLLLFYIIHYIKFKSRKNLNE